MPSPQIEILISPTGDTRITTHGFQGPKCREATKALERALGRKLTETLTAEFHLAATEEASLAERPHQST
jgi:hypothetical protein